MVSLVAYFAEAIGNGIAENQSQAERPFRIGNPVAALLIFDVVLVLVFACSLATVLRPPSKLAFLVSLFVLVWADLVLAVELLSLLVLIKPIPMVAVHAFLAAVALAVRRAAGNPRPPEFRLPSRDEIVRSVKSVPDLWFLGAAVGLTYVLLAVLNVLVPPNNIDSLAYHLTRVAFWIQHRSLAPWPTPYLSQTAFPPNAEIGSLASMLFLHRDLLAGFTQWFSALAASVSIFGLARGFGSSRRQAGFAALLFLTLPMIVLQATTTQNDLTAAALVTAMVFLLWLGLRTRQTGMLILSGAAMGLALGTKFTVVMALPGFAAGLAYIILTRKPRPIRMVLTWAGACAAGFVLLGAFMYVQNWRYFRSPIGSQEMLSNQVNHDAVGLGTLIHSNVARDIYSLMDLCGVPNPLANAGVNARARLGAAAFKVLGVPKDSPELDKYGHTFTFKRPKPQASEAGSFFGPLGFFLWLPLVLYWSVTGFIKRDGRLIPALAFLGFLLVIGGSQAWLPFRGRFYCGVIALSAPLVAAAFRPGRWPSLGRGLIIVAACMVMAVTTVTNVQKPLVGPEAIWSKARIERRYLIWNQAQMAYRRLCEAIPPRATVADIMKFQDPEYVLFGEELERTIIPIHPPPKAVDPEWLEENPYRYIMVHSTDLCPVAELPSPQFQVLTARPFKLIIRRDQARRR